MNNSAVRIGRKVLFRDAESEGKGVRYREARRCFLEASDVHEKVSMYALAHNTHGYVLYTGLAPMQFWAPERDFEKHI